MAETERTRQLARNLHDTRETIDQVRRLLNDLIISCHSPAIDSLTVKPTVLTALDDLSNQAAALSKALREDGTLR